MKNLNGFLLVNKPVGWTSFDVCAKARKLLGVKRIGHTGTLDPFATGLLVVAVGKCTKMIPFLEQDQKVYRTKILFGKTSETLDPESAVEDVFNGVEPTLEEIQKILEDKFTGKIDQIPPKYSALKINGKRAYDLARQGKEVEMKPREAEVFSVKVVDYDFPVVEIELSVAAGFYVRSFARDLGTQLCGGGMCQALHRIGVGDVDLESTELPVVEALEKISEGDLIDAQFLIKNFDHIEISEERLPDFQGGRAVFEESLRNKPNGEKILVLVNGETVGVGEVASGNLQPRIVL